MAAKKYYRNLSGKITELAATIVSAGSANEGDIVALGTDGRLDLSVVPTGFGVATATIPASENLAACDLVNIWDDGGTTKVRKADATVSGKEAHGFVKAGVTAPANASVYFAGDNSGLTGLVGGDLYLSTTAGQATSTAPSGSGNVIQLVGVATSATAMNFESNTPFYLA
jgi:hypothetical protein